MTAFNDPTTYYLWAENTEEFGSGENQTLGGGREGQSGSLFQGVGLARSPISWGWTTVSNSSSLVNSKYMDQGRIEIFFSKIYMSAKNLVSVSL
jgi:hypothetical protein